MKENAKITIIAEACQNHKGDFQILKDMIHAAKDAGANYIKIQSMLADNLTHRERFEKGITGNGVVKAIKRPYKAEYERLKSMDLDDKAHIWFVEECKKIGIKPLTSVFSRSRIPFLTSLDWDEVKIASYDCSSLAMIQELKGRFSHLYISTGATLDKEIESTAQLLADHSFSFLHCITIYPTPLNELHLARLEYLFKFTPSVGFSDHTLVNRDGIKGAIVAMSLGANIVERHFTILDADQTKDGPVSINPAQLQQLVNFSRMTQNELQDYVQREIPEAKQMIGKTQRHLSHAELLNRDYYRGRFASRFNNEIIYNWEEKAAF